MTEGHHAARRFAVYVSGDSAVYFPGLVALESIRRLNPHLPLDLFMSFPEAALAPEHVAGFDEVGITFIPAAELDAIAATGHMRTMREGQWPVEVFHNWVMPLYLERRGYTHAIKADYDILCMSPYALADVTPHDHVFAAAVFNVDLKAQGVPEDLLPDSSRAPLENVPYFNAGFAAINLAEYGRTEALAEFKRLYSAIVKRSPSVPAAEQAAWALFCAANEGTLAAIDDSYNVRATTLPRVSSDGRAMIRNAHFVTHNKPWRPPNYRYLANYVPSKRTCVYIYREAWLRAAERLPGFARHVSVPPPDELTTLGTLSTVFAEHYRQAR